MVSQRVALHCDTLQNEKTKQTTDMSKSTSLFSFVVAAALTTAAPLTAQTASRTVGTKPLASWKARIGQQVPVGGLGVWKDGKHAPVVARMTPTGGSFTKASLTPRAVQTLADAQDGTTTLPQAAGWGMLEGSDGKSWFYTQSYTTNSSGYYASSTITVFDASHKEMGSITVNVPDGQIVNYIQPYGTLTKKFFDRDDKSYEVTVYVHAIGENYTNLNTIYVYRLDGTLVSSYDASSSVLVDASTNAWTTYQRMAVLDTDEADENDSLSVNILRPASWGSETATVDHTFKLHADDTNYAFGTYFNAYVTDDNSPYYVTAAYTGEYVTGYDSDENPIINPDVKYRITAYDKNYAQVAQIEVPIVKPESSYMRMAGFGVLGGKDLSKGYYTKDGDFNFVVTFVDYIVSSDDYVYTFEVYNSKGELVKTIADNVDQWSALNDVAGQEEQVAFFKTVNSAVEVHMVDLPSCMEQAVIPSYIDGNLISTTLNRVPSGDSYQYLISMGQSASDDEGNVIARIGWYAKDLTPTKMTSFNLGQNGEYFTPYLSSDGLDPYLVNTDSQREFIYIAKMARDDGSNKVDNVLVVASEDGTPLRTYRGDDNMSYYSGAITNYGTSAPELFVAYAYSDDERYGQYKLDFHSLPFERFTQGGDGTADNPYLVATAGDLMQMHALPASACYRLTADIDMSTVPSAWTPLESYSGQFDGDGHSISHLRISDTSYRLGFVSSMLNGSAIKNVNFVMPTVALQSQNAYCGVVAGDALGSTFDNVHVAGANVYEKSGEVSAAVGGLVGAASLNSAFTSCSFSDGDIVTAGSPVGGIVADLRTSSYVKACVTDNATLVGESSIGGIAGFTDRDVNITNCHADIDIQGTNTLGGIVGDNNSRGLVTNCYAEGVIEAKGGSHTYDDVVTNDMVKVGGIVGSLTPLYTTTSTPTYPIQNCVSAISEFKVPDYAVTDNDSANTVHRIVGYTYVNDNPKAIENYIKDNYASGTTLLNGAPMSFAAAPSAISTDGATLDNANLTSAYFNTSLGYAYGSVADTPWKASDKLPLLYFENQALALTLSSNALFIPEEGTATLVAMLYGVDKLTDDITFESSNPVLCNVKSVETKGNSATATIECLNSGTCTVTARCGDFTAECTVIGLYPEGIATVEGNNSGNLRFAFDAGHISCDGAATLRLYSLDGRQLREEKGSTLSTASLTRGTYIVVATSAKGESKSMKLCF